MEKILTISIAAYNVENYIKKTLDSLIIEEILPKLEIFVIDDGGTDGTADIVEKYANKYPASISLIHKDNGGYGSTVNWSIEHATGKYFKLLDGDDWFESRNLTDYISRLEKSTADAVISNTYEIRDGKKIEKYPFCKMYDGVCLNISEVKPYPVVAMWGYTYKTKVLREANISLPLHMLYTDQIYVIKALGKVKSVEYYGKVVYNWRIGRKDQSNSINSIRRHYKDLIESANIINNYIKENNLSGNYIRARAAAYYSNTIITLCKLKKTRENYEIIKDIERNTEAEYPELYLLANNAQKLRLFRKLGYIGFLIL